jgi:hypothetical protein
VKNLAIKVPGKKRATNLKNFFIETLKLSKCPPLDRGIGHKKSILKTR